MKKIIRWPGLVVFVVIVGGMAAFWILLADKLVERMIESKGTAMVGAKVEIADLDLSLVPAGIKIRSLEVADPDSPMTNAVEIDAMVLSIDSPNLLRRKLIIDQMGIDGLRFGTARSYSGAIQMKSRQPDDGSSSGVKKVLEKFDFPSFELPDPMAILAKEELETIKLANTLKADIADEKEAWEKRLEELPDKNDLVQYRTQIDRLKAKSSGLAGLLGKAGDTSMLYKQIKADVDEIKAAKEEFDHKTKAFETWALEVSQLPARDLSRLMERYAFSLDGMANISGLLFGEKFAGWIKTARTWHDRLKPHIAKALAAGEDHRETKAAPPRGKGINVRFREANPLPDFLIRDIHASAVLAVGNLDGKVQNLTFEQRILGAPTTFAFGGTGLKRAASASVSGTLNYIDPGRPIHSIDLAVEQYAVQKAALVNNEAFSATLESALADLTLRARLDADGLNTSGNMAVNQASLTLDTGKDSGPVKEAIKSILAEIASFSVQATATGPLEDIKIGISSDLDEALRTAVTTRIKSEIDQLQGELKVKIDEKVQAEVGDTTQYLTVLDGVKKELTSRLTLGESLLAVMSRR